ncbi:MAG: hypothetical protein FWH48_09150 [Oscillospiraceae bacterium]|nr:hypothetical protein [Oscillospiraceae bacterium]
MDKNYCQCCGRLMTAENKMYGINPDGSRNEELCQPCATGNPTDEKSLQTYIIEIVAIIVLWKLLKILLRPVFGTALDDTIFYFFFDFFTFLTTYMATHKFFAYIKTLKRANQASRRT